MQHLQKYHKQQYSSVDNGIVCVKTIINYFGGNTSLERLRELSGSNGQTTTLKGLLQAGKALGLDGKGYQAEMSFLQKLEVPCILHVSVGNSGFGFVVCYGYDDKEDVYWIGDPAKRKIKTYTAEQLKAIWTSRFLLAFSPTEHFKPGQAARLFNWERFKQFFAADRNILRGVILLGLITSLLSLPVVIVTQLAIDQFLVDQNLIALGISIGTLVALILLKNYLDYARDFFLLRQRSDLSTRVNDYVYKVVSNLPNARFEGKGVEQLKEKIAGIDQAQRDYVKLISELITNALTVLLAIFALFFYEWVAALIMAASLGIIAYILKVFYERMEQKQHAVEETSIKIPRFYAEHLYKNPGANPAAFAEGYKMVQKLNHFHQISLFNQSKLGISFSFFLETSASLGLAIALFFGLAQIQSGNLSIGGLIAVIVLMIITLSAATTLAKTILHFQKTSVAVNRMNDFILG